MERTAELKFHSGEYVRYGGKGICKIEQIDEKTDIVTQETSRYYVLTPVRSTGNASGIVMYIPIANEALCSRMQPLHSKEEIDAMLHAAAEAEYSPWQEDRKLRGADFRRILAAGNVPEMLQMIRDILAQQTRLTEIGKRLSAMDDRFCKEAETMLDEEFAFSLGISPAEAGRYICEHLNRES